MKNFKDFLKIKAAAQFLGVTQNTLRNWESKNKIKAYRHPHNQYRLYDKKELETLLSQIK